MKYFLLFPILALLSASLLHVAPLHSQSDPDFRIEMIQRTVEGALEFTFRDAGTGATSYFVESSTDLTLGNWVPVPEALITGLGGGVHRVVIDTPAGTRAFYRVVGLGGSGGPIIIEFSTVAFQVVEGDTVLPMLVLNQPFNGIVYYTVSGTAMSGDYLELSGQVAVNGTTATIPVTLTDNDTIGRLKFLTLRLEAGPGYQLEGKTQTTITIGENDAIWEGTFASGNSALPFLLRITQQSGVVQGVLTSDAFGFFPTDEVPVTLTLTDDTFIASAASIPMPAEATLFDLPLIHRLDLEAANGTANQEVGTDRIQGRGTLITTMPGASHLNATNVGTFILTKSPTRPSTDEVSLVNVP